MPKQSSVQRGSNVVAVHPQCEQVLLSAIMPAARKLRAHSADKLGLGPIKGIPITARM